MAHAHVFSGKTCDGISPNCKVAVKKKERIKVVTYSRFAGYIIPWVIMVDSRATTAEPSEMACSTSRDTNTGPG